MPDRIILIVLIILSLAGLTAAPHVEAGPSRPNILLIVTDDQGWADIGYHNDDVRTPNIDKLCKMGVELDAHYVQPQCTPTRVALMTGRYPSRFGPGPTKATNAPAYPKGTLTMASMLKAIGYDTALMGKWHMGSTPDHGPNHFGFDYSYGSLAGAVGNYNHRYRIGSPFEITWHRNHEIIKGYENGTHTTDLIAADAVRYLEKPRDKPFFLYVPFHAIHLPIYEEDPKWADMNKHIVDEDRRAFLAAASHMDDAIGKIINAIENSVALENTIVIFTSDNGGVNGAHRGNAYPAPDPPMAKGFSSNAPLRGGKMTAYEGGIRVPAFITWVGKLEPGKKAHRMHAVDWMPTLAKLFGIEEPKDAAWDGQDVWPLIAGEQPDYDSPRTIYTNWGDRRWEALHHADLKIVRVQGKPWQLYDLAKDPNETSDLAQQLPDKVNALKAVYQAHKELDQ